MVLHILIIISSIISIAVSPTVPVMEEYKKFYRSLPEVDFSLANARKSDVIYKYFSDPAQEVGKLLTEDNVNQEITNKSIPMVLIIHGWTTDDTSPWYSPLKSELFKLGPHNIIYIDWSVAGNQSYNVSSANVKPVGEFIAQFLIESGVPQEKIHVIDMTWDNSNYQCCLFCSAGNCVLVCSVLSKDVTGFYLANIWEDINFGHSLGSQLSSFIGKSMLQLSGKRLGRISALDPAGPKFENSLMGRERKLCDGDADFVDVVHTDIQLFGYTAPIGHVDWYPNEGKHQPGCPDRVENENCCHARATLFYIESISRKSKAHESIFKEIDNEVTITVKDNASEVIFGHHVDTSARGTYYFETNPQSPFLK